MPLLEQAQTLIQINSSVVTAFTASPSSYYVIDTATAAVTVTLPAGIGVGQIVTVQNYPSNGAQVGGPVAGNSLTILTSGGETFDDGSSTSQSLGPPTSTITAAARTYYPTGAGSQAGFSGWVH